MRQPPIEMNNHALCANVYIAIVFHKLSFTNCVTHYKIKSLLWQAELSKTYHGQLVEETFARSISREEFMRVAHIMHRTVTKMRE